MTHYYKRFVQSYISLAEKRPAMLLVVYLIIAVIGLVLATQKLSIETDLAALLPEGTDSVRALEISEDRIGAIDFFTIAIESKSGDVAAIAKMQDILKSRIEAEWEDADWVQIGRNTEFFRKHALYYLEKKELVNLHFLLEEEISSASAKKMPGLVDLLDGEYDEGLDDWYSEDIPWRMGLPSQVCRSFNAFFNNCDSDSTTKKTPTLPDVYSDRLIAPEGDVGVILVKLNRASTDVDYCKFALLRGEALIRDIDPSGLSASMRAEVVGAYRKFNEIKALASDGQTATLISVCLVLLIVIAFFRSFRTVLVIFIPLIAAACITMGIVSLTYGRLTVLTIFILALLVGIGIDYGIHLFRRAQLEIQKGQALAEALNTSLYETGQVLFAAAATTIAALLVLLTGHFEGFREFGVVASIGLVLCAAISILMIPPLIFFIQLIRPIRTLPKTSIFGGFAGRLNFGMDFDRAATYAFFFTLAIIAGLAAYTPDTQFEYDIRNIMAPGTETPIDYMRAIGTDSGTAPAIVLAKDRATMKEVHDYLLNKLVVEKDETIKSFITYHTFVPTMADQVKRRKVIKSIGTLLEKKALQDIDGDKGRLIDELAGMTQAEPFDHSQLPKWARRMVTEANGEIGNIGLIYADIDEWNVYSGQEFQDRYGHLTFGGLWLPIASSRFILSDVMRMVKSDGLRLLVIVSIVLVVILLLFLRKIKPTIVLFAVLALGGLWTAGIMGLLDIRLSLYNIIVIPVILGVGIDGAIHLYLSHRQSGSLPISGIIASTGLTVSASSITTMAGFMGLLFVDHKGLQTIGQFGTIGIAASWLAVILLMPFLLKYTESGNRERVKAPVVHTETIKEM